MTFSCILEEFADTKDVIKIHKSKMYRQHNDLKKRTKGQTTIYKVQHRKLKIGQHESPLKAVHTVSLKITIFYVVATN
jgi:hypothetical protein